MALVELTNRDLPQARSSEDSLGHMATRLQRKESLGRLRSCSESLRSRASSNNSIFDAPCCDLDEFSTKDNHATPPDPPFMSGALGASSALHIPHKLETIIEQKSIATLRQSTSLTLRQKESIISQLSRKTSLETLRARAKVRRRNSFSLNDMAAFQSFRRFLRGSVSTIDSGNGNSFEVIRAYPAQPPHHPLERRATPDGLPTFNTPEAAAYRLPSPPIRCRDVLRGRDTGEARWIKQTVGLPRGVLMRGDDFLVRGTFRKPPGAHTYMPRATPGQGFNHNGFPTRRSHHVDPTSTPMVGRDRHRASNSNPSDICMVPQLVSEQATGRPARKQPSRKTSWIRCCCCSVDDAQAPETGGTMGRQQAESESLEALRMAIRSGGPLD